MNERIKELIQQAGSIYDPSECMSVFNKEKFAELIVQELIEVGRQAFLKDNRVVPVFPAQQIKEHFGAKE